MSARSAALLPALLALACAARPPTPAPRADGPPDAGPRDAAPADAPSPAEGVRPRPLLRGVTQIALAPAARCALSEGRVACWRGDVHTSHPVGPVPDRFDDRPPVIFVPGIRDARALCVTWANLCVVRADHTVFCRGLLRPDLHDLNTRGPSIVEGSPAALRDVDAVEADGDSCAAIQRDGRRVRITPPTRPDGPWDLAVSPAAYPRCEITGGVPRCVGDNRAALLANRTTPAFTAAAPSNLFGLTGIREVAFAERHACAVLLDGSLRCWGSNLNAALGQSDLRSRALPTPVPGLTQVAEVRVARDLTCVRQTTGDVRCWGTSRIVAGGDGDRSPFLQPTSAPAFRGAEELRVIDDCLCARRVDGTVWCWEALAPGGRAPRSTPILLEPSPPGA